ncbi:Conserved_hypothetical protein [Hexamita inflata]|uniref:BPI-like protein n=1 Tax=Hexamita inflata TaxID=28002 RepID=A0AA86N7V2_9EUKA|nr:Conserved hypothetical protein [Hexamita inflata]
MYVQIIFMCSTQMFPRVLYSNDSAYQLVLTQSGANKYLTKYLSSGLFNGLIFPDQHFDVNLGVSSVLFSFENMIVSNFYVSQTVSFLNGDNITQVSFMGCEFVLDLDWQMQQNSYPYQSDSGSGKILIQDASFSMIVTTHCDYAECYDTLVSKIINVKIQLDVFKIILSGSSSWFYQSVINFVLGFVQAQMLPIIQQYIEKTATNAINKLFKLYDPIAHYIQKYYDVVKDERFVDGWVIGKGYAALIFSGYFYNLQNYSDEFITNKFEPVTLNKLNDEVQLIISLDSINNYYYIFHKYTNVFSGSNYQVTSAPFITLVYTGIVLNLKINYQNMNQCSIQLFGKPHFSSQTSAMAKLYFTYTVMSSDCSLSNEEIQYVIKQFNANNEEAYYYLNNVPDITEFNAFFDVDENVMRLHGSLKYNY